MRGTTILLSDGTHDSFPWGEVIDIHRFNGVDIVESKKDSGVSYHPYVDGQDTNQSYSSLDGALLGALAYRYDGLNSQATLFMGRMLGID